MNDQDFFPFEIKASCSVTRKENQPSERSVVIDISTVGELDFRSPKTTPESKTKQLLNRKKKVVRRAKQVIKKLETQREASPELSEEARKNLTNQIEVLLDNLKQLGEEISDSEDHGPRIMPISDPLPDQFEISNLMFSSSSNCDSWKLPQNDFDEEEQTVETPGSIIVTDELSKSISLEHDYSLCLDDLTSDDDSNDPKSASQPVYLSNDPLSASVSIKKVDRTQDVVYGDSTVWMFVPITDVDREKTLRRKMKEKLKLLPNFSKVAKIMDNQFQLLKKGRKQQMQLSILMSQHKNEHFVILVDPDLQIANAVYSLGHHAEKCCKIWGDGDDTIDVGAISKYWRYNFAGQIFDEVVDGKLDDTVIAISV